MWLKIFSFHFWFAPSVLCPAVHVHRARIFSPSQGSGTREYWASLPHLLHGAVPCGRGCIAVGRCPRTDPHGPTVPNPLEGTQLWDQWLCKPPPCRCPPKQRGTVPLVYDLAGGGGGRSDVQSAWATPPRVGGMGPSTYISLCTWPFGSLLRVSFFPKGTSFRFWVGGCFGLGVGWYFRSPPPTGWFSASVAFYGGCLPDFIRMEGVVCRGICFRSMFDDDL